ncbi:MAG: Lon protease [Spirochaetes bacterium DG_61]|nr:MAG: Lon protease [Spirochaetes bacterium DG_61]
MATVDAEEKTTLVSVDRILPSKLSIISMKTRPIFPGILIPLVIGGQKYIKTIEKIMEIDGYVGVLLVKNGEIREDRGDNFYRVGTIGKVMKTINLPDGKLNIFINTLKRFEVKKFLTMNPYVVAAVNYIDEEVENDKEFQALVRTLYLEIKEVSEDNPFFTEEIKLNIANLDGAGKVVDFVSSILNVDREVQQDILETFELKKRVEKVLNLLHREKELMKLQKKIQDQINEKVTKQQREFFLQEQMKAIKKELGMEVDQKTSDYNKFKEILDELELVEEVSNKAYEELEKLNVLDTRSPEYAVTRNYLETICALPWNSVSPDDIDIPKARRILDQDHYDLDEVKDRILEFLSVKKLKPGSRGSILCFVGPPGVGKTSVGKSIARAMNRKFFRFSLGGMRDEAEIKGHRRTYIGAMPGRIIQALKIVGLKNPVLMLDEIDKLGISFQGDPASALLEVLDPEQNVDFRDHYLDLPFDLSNVLFITTANTIDTIPGPLLDRMEVIRLSGYIEKEKVEIGKRYIIPRSLDRNGLKDGDVRFERTALTEILQGYVKEAGLRNFEKAIDKISRRIARKHLEKEIDFPYVVNKENLRDFLGERVFIEEISQRIKKPGIAIGLAWTPLGGATLTVESILIPGEGTLKLTGSLGDVMVESANIAFSFVRSVMDRFKVDNNFFEHQFIHLHVPAGATPKDGPSAGITMASAMLSLVTGKKIRNNLTMTGELSLIGNVFPVGGIKEKVIAAKRARMKEIILPSENQKDLSEIPEHIKKGITFHLVETMNEVVKFLFD